MRHTRLVYAPVITAEFNCDSLNKVSKSTNTLSLPCLVETARNMLDGASSSERRLLRRLINPEIAHYARYSMKAAEPIRLPVITVSMPEGGGKLATPQSGRA